MTCPQTRRAIPTLALVALASCAGPATHAPAGGGPHPSHGPSAPEPKAEYQKPVRMNGRGTLASISLGDFFALHQAGKALVYDARPAFFYQLGHVPGAVNLTKIRCDDQIVAREAEIKAALAKGQTIVVYCTGMTCPDARTVAIHIAGFGYPAKIFSGGWDAWKDAAMPVE